MGEEEGGGGREGNWGFGVLEEFGGFWRNSNEFGVILGGFWILADGLRYYCLKM